MADAGHCCESRKYLTTTLQAKDLDKKATGHMVCTTYSVYTLLSLQCLLICLSTTFLHGPLPRQGVIHRLLHLWTLSYSSPFIPVTPRERLQAAWRFDHNCCCIHCWVTQTKWAVPISQKIGSACVPEWMYLWASSIININTGKSRIQFLLLPTGSWHWGIKNISRKAEGNCTTAAYGFLA